MNRLLQLWLTLFTATAILLTVCEIAIGDENAAPKADTSRNLKVVPIWTKDTPPDWAFWERHVLDQLFPASQEFVAKYTRDDGTIIWRDEWPGMDGSDDGYESFYNFPLYYALGGHADMVALSEKLWDGVTRQFTDYGLIDDEFDEHYDWMHHGESYTYFYFFGLSNPTLEKHRNRAIKFGRLYLGDEKKTSNFDPARNLMRSPLTGSHGPHYKNTAEDWVTHRPILANYPLPFNDIPNVRSSEDWNDDERFAFILQAINERMMQGDVPLNLTATSMMANTFMHTGDESYRKWVIDYVNAWKDRVEKNDGILPDNVGLSGKVGENMNGNWWGGYYGWHWPHGLFNQVESTLIGSGNALMLSGDASALDLPRSVIDLVTKQGKVENGQMLVPHRYGKDGWFAYREFNAKYLGHLWFLSRSDEDWQRLTKLANFDSWKTLSYRKGKGDSENVGPWLMYVRGDNESYPLDILKAGYRESLARLEAIRQDTTLPAEQDVHHWQKLNPVILEGLVQLTLGAPNHIYHGGLLHTSVRYFDPERKRPGLPPDVAALVERLTPNGIRLKLVNLNSSKTRRVIVQGGMFGEHQIARVKQVVHYPYQFDTINHKCFEVELAPSAVGRLEIDLERFANTPSYAFPWHTE
ncbi:MAG: hypothetical protein KDB27_10365 [Planctomycetales bacterium]|nr:hypothetical protein [Planctomycetales bacterium]